MFRKILAGTDGSDSATLALAHAAFLAEKLGAELVVATAHTDRGESGSGKRAGALDTGAVIAGALLRDVESRYGTRIPITTKAAPGAADDVLLGLAIAEDCDLLAVGNRGLSKSALLQPSSVPGRVARRAPVAVLVVDTMGKRQPRYERILVGTDGSSTAAVAVEAAHELSEALRAELHLAAVTSSEREGRRILDGLQARWPGSTVHLLSGEASEALADLAESQSYDLAVVGNRGMAGVRRALGNVPLRVLRRSPSNVLIVNTTG
jgi:nucleotide-binding universal stress UspA family protein